MKVFIASLVIFIVLISILVANCIYICDFSDKFDSLAKKFGESSIDGAKEAFERLSELWNQNKFFITLTNDHSRIEEIEQGLLKMDAAITANDFTLYTEARLTLLRIKKLLREYDVFSLEGLM